MSWWVLGPLLWVSVGIGTAVTGMWVQWYAGDDLKLDDLGMWATCMALGPVAVLLIMIFAIVGAIRTYAARNRGILLKGRMAPRAMKMMREPWER